MDGYDPFNFYGMGSAADPFNYYARAGYSTQFGPTMTSPFGDAIVGNASPQASYYSSDPYAPSGEASRYGVNSGAGTGSTGTPYVKACF